MSVTERHLNLIRLKLEMVQEEKKQLIEAVDSHLSQILHYGHLFVDTHDKCEMSFKDISLEIENAIIRLGDATAIFKSKSRPVESHLQSFVDAPYESSGSLSFEVLQKLPIQPSYVEHSYIKTYEDVPTSVLKQQIQACSTKIETLSNTLVRVIGDLNTLKKPVGLESTNTSLSLEDNEKFVELKKKLCNSLEELETISKQIERVNKDLSDQKTENKEKLIFLENRLSNLENKIANSDTDFKAKFISLEKEWNKFQINTNTLEQRINKSENNINDIDHRLCQFQEKTSSILEEKEKELTVMSGEISSTIQDLVSLKEEGSSKSIKDMALTIKALEVWVKEDLQHKVADLEEPVKQLQLLNLDKAMEEHKSLLSDVISSQSLLGTKIQELEKKMKPRLVTIQQLCAMIKMGSRVKRGPNWNNQIHGNADGAYPSLGTVILEIPAYKKFRVKWDNGYENNYTVDPQMNFSEIQLASLPEID